MIKSNLIFDKRLIFILIFFLYVLFPTNNSSLDSYAYAGYVKYNYYLFTPHHLFSNAIVYVLLKPFLIFNFDIDILLFSKIINSIFQIFNLLIFYQILKVLKIKEVTILKSILILAFSFSLWRYGTENETYIIPISFSLLSSFYFIKDLNFKNNRFILYSSLFGVIACLFHQIHFFWWFGLLFGFYLTRKKIRNVCIYLLPTLLVPISYILVLIYYEKKALTIHNLIHFVFNDFYQGSVMTDFGWKGFFFQAINTVRTYFQIHGNIYLLIKSNGLYIIPCILCVFIFIKTIQLSKNKLFIKKKDLNSNVKLIINIHLLIFLLSYSFAFYNAGNVEFMVMTPFLIILCFILKYRINNNFLKGVAIILLIWNFSYGIFPNFYYSYYNDGELVKYMISNKEKIFVIKNHTTISQYFYKTGIDNPKNIYRIEKLSDKEFQELLKNNHEIYTDIIDKPEVLNKIKMTSKNLNINLKNLKVEKVFTYSGFYGKTTVNKISGNQKTATNNGYK